MELVRNSGANPFSARKDLWGHVQKGHAMLKLD